MAEDGVRRHTLKGEGASKQPSLFPSPLYVGVDSIHPYVVMELGWQDHVPPKAPSLLPHPSPFTHPAPTIQPLPDLSTPTPGPLPHHSM